MKIIYEVGDTICYNELGVEMTSVVKQVNMLEGGMDNAISVSYLVEYGNDTIEVNEADVIHKQSLGMLVDDEGILPNMLSWRQGLPSRPDNSNMPYVLTLLMAIQYDKEGYYGSSWKGKGEYRGIMSNIDRKYDRLDKMTSDELSGAINSLEVQERMLTENFDLYSEQVGESKVDAIADLANYSIMYLGYVMENFPNVFKVWVDKNLPKYLAEKIDFLQ